MLVIAVRFPPRADSYDPNKVVTWCSTSFSFSFFTGCASRRYHNHQMYRNACCCQCHYNNSAALPASMVCDCAPTQHSADSHEERKRLTKKHGCKNWRVSR